MQVDKDRFPAVLPHFLALLRTCEFYAFDEEMTGINVPDVAEAITDPPEASYRAKRLAASRYSMIQVGICLFHRDREAEAAAAAKGQRARPRCYTARPFNFILFPNWNDELAQLQLTPASGGAEGSVAGDSPHLSSSSSAGGVGKDVVLSPSALSFLRRHGMDFQQWVYRGISLCDGDGEKALRRHLADKHKASDDSVEQLPAFFTDEEKAWVSESIVAAEALVRRVADAEAQASPAAVLALSREVMLTPQTSRSAREHLRGYAKRHFPSVTVSFRRQGGGAGATAMTTTTLTALTAAEAARRAEREAQQREREVADLLGFRLVFAVLAESGKPCVGHNCFADLLFLMAALDQPLPETLAEWKARVSLLFPSVFDTKYLVSRKDLFPAGRFPANYLGGLFEQYGFASPRVRVTVPTGFEAYDPISLLSSGAKGGGGGGPAHEAAFDALMTGILLLNVLCECGALGDGTAADGVGDVGPELANKIALFRSLFALSLSGADEYTPDTSAAIVLDVQHDATVKTAQLEGLVQSVAGTTAATGHPPPLVVLHSVDNASRSLAVIHHAADTASALSEKLALKFPSLMRVSPFTPPHHHSQRRIGSAAFAFPSTATIERTLLRSRFPRK